MIGNTLSKHIDNLQVNLLRDRLRVSGLSLNEMLYLHGSNNINRPPEHKALKAKTHVSAKKLFDTCAVVSNRDDLRQSKCGAEIDAHDYVMRSNMAPTQGFTDDVGNRTDFMAVHQTRFLDIARCIQNKYSSCHESAKRELSDLGDANMWIVKHGGINPKSFDQIAKFARYNAIDLVLSYPNMKYLRTTISSFWGFNIDVSSNGIFLFTVAVPLCKKISLYGFQTSSMKNSSKVNPYFMDSPLQEFNQKNVLKRELKQLESLNATRTLRLVSLPCSL
ncbi:alpha-2,8-sialyltransferase 8B-like [Anneissia japonica]|uniref:alpha-2,8-sialyltransferase 8B-like n=1 Tax=Anneissia japonica TaxID=1529436 RepID=UPI001425AF52|nr:alpha-2,8-sialyltransferase 8B-like [Anneissia japonica]